MKTYEGMFLADSRKANRDWDAVAAHVSGILEKSGAKPVKLKRWAEHKLAYPIKKHTRGTYVLTYFETPDQEGIISEIYRQVAISDTVLRAMVLRIKRVPEVEEPPPPVEKGEAEAASGPPAQDAGSEKEGTAPAPAAAGGKSAEVEDESGGEKAQVS